jgi:demethylmenaquinone methyltransferase/2-methoxy-6-polyprenyl-1,4-benzoquinol methylase
MSKEEILNDSIKPYNEHENKTSQLVRMFNGLSGKYDSFNDLVSFGLSHSWRKEAILTLKKYSPSGVLDIATGTADMCLAINNLLKSESIYGIDVSDQMIEVGKEKVKKNGLENVVKLEVQDCASLSFKDNSFDAVTISFGIRNLEKLSVSLNEINRVLSVNGHFLIIEVNEPQNNFLKFFYKFYVKIVFWLASVFLSKDRKAFNYLANTMGNFPQGKKLIKIIENEGFKLEKFKKLTFGVCSFYLFIKK